MKKQKSEVSDQKSEKAAEENPLLTIEKIEGVCPGCGQPFLAEYVAMLEDKVMMAIESIKTLETVLRLKNRKIKELEDKKLVLVRKDVNISKH